MQFNGTEETYSPSNMEMGLFGSKGMTASDMC